MNFKKIIIICCVIKTTLLTVSFTFCQTLKATQDWIKETVEVNAYFNDYEDFKYIYNLKFDKTNLLIKDSYIPNRSEPTYVLTREIVIPIKELNIIRFEERENTTWLMFSIKGNQKLIKNTSTDDDTTKYLGLITIKFLSK